MQSRPAIEKRFGLIRTWLFVGWAVISTIVVFWSVRSAADRAFTDVIQKAGETLAVQTETLSGVLDKYRLLPPLLSRQSSIRALFIRDAQGNAQTLDARRTAEEIAGMSAALDVAFLFPDGEVLANARGAFVKSGEGLPALIEAARQGRLGRAALSLRNNERTYAFSSGVRRDGKFIGVVIVYVDFYRVEAAWALSARRIFVTDKAGIVFLANDPDWRLKPVSSLRDGADQANRYLIEGRFEERLDMTRRLPLLEWDLHVLADPAPVDAARLSAAAIATLACLLLGMIALVLLRRGEAAVIRTRSDRATALRLERVVRDRTRALSMTNRTLSHEVEVRRQAEDRLRKAQAELVQTAKLAALGQMSAAISHEFNQPLAAIRSYADNAVRFLERGALSDVTGNLSRINGLVERMAELSRTLLSFSRKPGATIGSVPLGTIIEEALLLARPRARAAGVAIRVADEVSTLQIEGGRIRLGQVFVNLINNAIDALSGARDGLVEVSARRQADLVIVTVADNGPGIAQEDLAKVFDPFFTTKDVGEGIGIGLSIVDNIIRDFGGTIAVANRPEGGACFTINLRTASNPGRAMTGETETISRDEVV